MVETANKSTAAGENEKYFLKLMQARMPFGKYKGYFLVDLPEDYVMWFARKGFPRGALGEMLQCVYEIKLNGLDGVLKPLRKKSAVKQGV